jgi:hypothetical protein
VASKSLGAENTVYGVERDSDGDGDGVERWRQRKNVGLQTPRGWGRGEERRGE